MTSEAITEIAEIIGQAAIEKITIRFAGTDLYVPANIKPGHKIVRTIGLRAATQLSKHYGGGYVRVPSNKNNNFREARETRIVGQIKAGLSRSEVALKNDMTVRNVLYIYTNYQRRQTQ